MAVIRSRRVRDAGMGGLVQQPAALGAHRQHPAGRSRGTLLRHAGTPCHGGVTQTKWPPTNPGRFKRKRSGLPLKRPGRSSTNVEVTIKHLSNWRQYNVLAALDLDFCADVFGVARLTNEVLGRDSLECGRDVDPKEWGRVARAKAEEFTNCLS